MWPCELYRRRKLTCSRRVSLCPVPKAIRSLLCLYKCSANGPCPNWQGECVLVSIVLKYPARVLLDMRFILVLGPAREGLDRRRDGAFDTPTAAHLEKHIFVAEKGDYYEITDGLPQSPNH